MRLHDGRGLAYAEWGDPRGRPVLFFHGMLGSRLQRHPDESIARRLGVRPITIDRPGCGPSDFRRGRRLLDWPGDVAQLADALGLGRFALVGWSGSGPYVAACAFAMPDRVTAGAMVSNLGPLDAPGALASMTPRNRTSVRLARGLPWPAMRYLWGREIGRDAVAFYSRWLPMIPEADRAVASRPEILAVMEADFTEMVRRGTDGYARDVRILARPWGFDLREIGRPVFLWHGETDAQAPISMSRALAQMIPGSRLTVCAGEGHFLLFDHWREILETVTAA